MPQPAQHPRSPPRLAKTKPIFNPMQSGATCATASLSRIFLLNDRKRPTFSSSQSSPEDRHPSPSMQRPAFHEGSPISDRLYEQDHSYVTENQSLSELVGTFNPIPQHQSSCGQWPSQQSQQRKTLVGMANNPSRDTQGPSDRCGTPEFAEAKAQGTPGKGKTNYNYSVYKPRPLGMVAPESPEPRSPRAEHDLNDYGSIARTPHPSQPLLPNPYITQNQVVHPQQLPQKNTPQCKTPQKQVQEEIAEQYQPQAFSKEPIAVIKSMVSPKPSLLLASRVVGRAEQQQHMRGSIIQKIQESHFCESRVVNDYEVQVEPLQSHSKHQPQDQTHSKTKRRAKIFSTAEQKLRQQHYAGNSREQLNTGARAHHQRPDYDPVREFTEHEATCQASDHGVHCRGECPGQEERFKYLSIIEKLVDKPNVEPTSRDCRQDDKEAQLDSRILEISIAVGKFMAQLQLSDLPGEKCKETLHSLKLQVDGILTVIRELTSLTNHTGRTKDLSRMQKSQPGSTRVDWVLCSEVQKLYMTLNCVQVVGNKYELWTQKLQLLSAKMASLPKLNTEAKAKILNQTRATIRELQESRFYAQEGNAIGIANAYNLFVEAEGQQLAQAAVFISNSFADQ